MALILLDRYYDLLLKYKNDPLVKSQLNKLDPSGAPLTKEDVISLLTSNLTSNNLIELDNKFRAFSNFDNKEVYDRRILSYVNTVIALNKLKHSTKKSSKGRTDIRGINYSKIDRMENRLVQPNGLLEENKLIAEDTNEEVVVPPNDEEPILEQSQDYSVKPLVENEKQLKTNNTLIIILLTLLVLFMIGISVFFIRKLFKR